MNYCSNDKNIYSSFLAIWAAHFILDFMLGVWPVYKTIAQLDVSKAGWIAAVGMCVGEGLQLLFGVLSDRGYQKKLLLLGLGLVSCVSFLAYTDSYHLLFILMLCTYAGSGAFHPAGVHLVSGWSKQRKGVYMAIFASGGMLGEAISQRVFSHTYQCFAGHTFFFLIPNLILIVWCMSQTFPCRVPLQLNAPRLKERIREVLTHARALKWLYCLQVLTRSIVLSVVFLLPEVLYQRQFPDWFCLGGGHGCYIIGCALLTVPAGYLSDRYGMMPVLSIALGGSACIFGVLFFYGVLSLPITAVLLSLLGGFTGIISPLIVAAGTRIVAASAYGLVGGILMGGASCLASAGVMATGILHAWFGGDEPVKALQVIGLLYLATFILLWHMSKKSQAADKNVSYPHVYSNASKNHLDPDCHPQHQLGFIAAHQIQHYVAKARVIPCRDA